MKKSDIAILVLIVGISLIASYFIGKSVLASVSQQDALIEKTDPITAEITPPDPTIFSLDAINPAVPIDVGDSTNEAPFGG